MVSVYLDFFLSNCCTVYYGTDTSESVYSFTQCWAFGWSSDFAVTHDVMDTLVQAFLLTWANAFPGGGS